MALNDVECCDFYQVHEDVVRTVRDKMPDEDVLYDLAEVFKVFGDSTRIKILCCLFDGEMYVQELADRVGASQSAISHQLRLLKQAKLVKNRRQGKLVGYRLADDHVKTILGMAKEHLEEELSS